MKRQFSIYFPWIILAILSSLGMIAMFAETMILPAIIHTVRTLPIIINRNGSSDNEKLSDELANLLNETADAHHKAFAATEGEDPDWPIWYADYLLEKLLKMLKAKSTKIELTSLLVLADKKNGVVAPGAYWPRFYAKSF